MRLETLATGRANNFQLLRFAAASAVVWFHCYALTNRWTEEPLWRMTGEWNLGPLGVWKFGEWNLGALGVQVFFVISGFLVTTSWRERARLLPFLAARALRIYPALILATLFTLLLAKLSSPLPWGEFLVHPQTIDFTWRSATAWDLRYELPGAFAANPFPRAVNGSLWTLPVELRLYLFIALAGVIGLIARRTLLAAAIAVVIAATIVWPDWLPLQPKEDGVRHAALLFAVGALAAVYRDRIPVSLAVAIVAIVVALANPMAGLRGFVFAPLLRLRNSRPRLPSARPMSGVQSPWRLLLRHLRLRIPDPADVGRTVPGIDAAAATCARAAADDRRRRAFLARCGKAGTRTKITHSPTLKALTMNARTLHEISCADDYDPNSMPVDRARSLIREFVAPVAGVERIHIRYALERVLAEDIVSPVDVPGHDNSAMDGWAVRYRGSCRRRRYHADARRRIVRRQAVFRTARIRRSGAHLHRRGDAQRRGHRRHAGARAARFRVA